MVFKLFEIIYRYTKNQQKVQIVKYFIFKDKYTWTYRNQNHQNQNLSFHSLFDFHLKIM